VIERGTGIVAAIETVIEIEVAVETETGTETGTTSAVDAVAVAVEAAVRGRSRAASPAWVWPPVTPHSALSCTEPCGLVRKMRNTMPVPFAIFHPPCA
jgi:hypothetical protein